MGLYFIKGKGWRYDFTLKGVRYTGAWFKTKSEAKEAEAKRREEIKNPKQIQDKEAKEKTPTDMAFLDLVNKRLDYVKAYNSGEHYRIYRYLAKRWIQQWGKLNCGEITGAMIQDHILERSKVSAYTANKDLRYLRATFNYGLKKRLITSNPTEDMEFMPVEKRVKYVPPVEDIDKVIEVADPDTQDYLWAIRETMGRVSEINRLTWHDVDFEQRYVVLYTRKKRGGHLTPRKVAMTEKLFEVLSRRYENRDKAKPWIFWHRYWSTKEGRFKEGPYKDRKKIMKILCKKAGVKYFRFHSLRHAGASIMDGNNVPLGAIQRILGHENRRTTEIYLHSIGEMERQAMAVYERARKKSHTNSHTRNMVQKKRIRCGHLTLIKY
ncbi:MAG: site-specific integrase [Deltaproteobacteria bacterium]|nr:site-specific integrase [Deltaproteobacteria bacterium]MBW2128471.1 site-specific integrase [Deltaproteobacteria bacterium]